MTTRRTLGLAAIVLAASAAGLAYWRQASTDELLSAAVQMGTLDRRLTVTGVLRPADAISYRSPLGSREAEVTFLVPDGTRVGEGDLVARLDTADLQRELDRTVQEVRQAQVELQAAEIDWQSAKGAVDALAAGEGALEVAQSQAKLQADEKKAERLRAEYDARKPLLARGFITQEELNQTADALEQAQADLAIERQRVSVLVDQTRPRDEQRARLLVAQKASQRENVLAHLGDAKARGDQLRESIDACGLHARHAGLVVLDEYAGANPRRKVRVGDHVSSTQPLLTIPEVARMLVQASTSEADVHRFQPGQPAAIVLEAFPGVTLTGKVLRVGTLSSGTDRPIDDKRFDLIVEVDPSDVDLRPEMTARVDVLLGTTTGVLLMPINGIFDRQGLTVAHVITPLGVETRVVRLGESNRDYAIVLSGLAAGDRIALTDVAGATAAPAHAKAMRDQIKSSTAALAPK